MKTVGIIPARYGSSRLPGKPLADICGKPMIWWVYQRVKGIPGIEEIWTATDDRRIWEICKTWNIPVLMTSSDHQTAANRLEEVSRTISADYYVQLNGDEPLLNCQAVSRVIPRQIPQDRPYGVNIITPVRDPVQLMDQANIKVVFDQNYKALYMSRNPIPCPFRSLDLQFYKHVGIIGYNKKMLELYASTEPGPLEKAEGIDTLRFLDYGIELQMVPVDDLQSLSVDTLQDLERVRKIIEGQSK